jgi:hypothetical protein
MSPRGKTCAADSSHARHRAEHFRGKVAQFLDRGLAGRGRVRMTPHQQREDDPVQRGHGKEPQPARVIVAWVVLHEHTSGKVRSDRTINN